jgi:actin
VTNIKKIMNAIVIDVGSSVTKAGFAGDDAPCVVTPSLVGKPKQRNVMPWINTKSTFVGIEAQLKRGISAINYPVRRGAVNNINDLELLYHVTLYEELCVEPDEQPMLITEALMNPKSDTEQNVELLFEKFNIPALHVATHAVIYAMDRTSATIIDCGDGVTSVRPVYEGNSMNHAIRKMNLGGSDCTDYLKKIITERGYFLQTRAEREIVHDMKEKLAYVSSDYTNDIKKARDSSVFDKNYELPDGNVVTIGSERFRCAEVLFQPSIVTSTLPGIHELIHQSILASDIDTRRTLFENVVITGGSTMFPGLDERLRFELKCLNTSTDVKVVAYPERMFSQWIGASILANLSTFLQQCMIKEEYLEFGPEFIHRKGKDSGSDSSMD